MPASATGLFAVGDAEHIGRQLADVPVERGDPLALGRSADDDGLGGNVGRVKRVHRLAVFQHHIVRDVDDVVDRTDAAGAQARAHPERRRLDAHVFHRARGIARAERRFFYGYGKVVGNVVAVACGMYLRRAVLQRHAGGGRRLARDAEQRQTVGAVEGQLEVHDRVAQPQHVADVVAKPAGLLHNENAVLNRVREVVDRQPQLGQRAEHTLRDHPAQLAGLDDLAAGQLGAVEADGDEIGPRLRSARL